ncbi:troponin C, isotype gamma-like isoform X2 [Daktulosphaira vitifoliae]|uniref:troponin C, isotype gamma-like isoform X2 n=1 Tax=Daktulosphaira vitifoliae TaxID=58002 RepID=UPI0021A98BAD|nr:troponin C, isotype gamma-like isoform X2 [Daktulosphaira vitifoliae]XP_050534015.1 troponin C, isotype gamma-like isoform X2 [Daktulosphaira vitifoliae]
MFFQIIIQLFLVTFLKTSLAAPSYTHEITEEIPTNEITEEIPTNEITEESPISELSEFEKHFKSITPDFKDTKINSKILKKLLMKFGYKVTEQNSKEYLLELDPKGEGTCSLNKFLELPSNNTEKELKKELKTTFKIIDKNKDGFITENDLIELYNKFNINYDDNFVTASIKKYSGNNSNKIRFEDFFKIMTQNYDFSANSKKKL